MARGLYKYEEHAMKRKKNMLQHLLLALATAMALLVLSGCLAEEVEEPVLTCLDGTEACWEIIQPKILAASGSGLCAFCHKSPNGAGPSGLIWEYNQYATIVTNNKTSPVSLDTLQLIVNPGDKSTSFLYRKVAGLQDTGGGEGEQMPLTLPPLNQADIDLIGAWIDGGAAEF